MYKVVQRTAEVKEGRAVVNDDLSRAQDDRDSRLRNVYGAATEGTGALVIRQHALGHLQPTLGPRYKDVH